MVGCLFWTHVEEGCHPWGCGRSVDYRHNGVARHDTEESHHGGHVDSRLYGEEHNHLYEGEEDSRLYGKEDSRHAGREVGNRHAYHNSVEGSRLFLDIPLYCDYKKIINAVMVCI